VEVVNLFRCSHGPSCNSFFGNMHSFCNLRGIYFLRFFFFLLSTTLEFLPSDNGTSDQCQESCRYRRFETRGASVKLAGTEDSLYK